VITGLGSAQSNTPAQSDSALAGAVSAAQSDLFSGAATWSYPLHVPPGRNGLQPDLTLSYNSHLADTKQTNFQESGWLGLGFNLELGFVALEPIADYEAVSVDINGTKQPDGPFGARTKLVRQGNWFPQGASSDLVAEFRLQQDNFLRVELMRNGEARDENLKTNLLMASTYPQALDNLYWIVTTKEGTRYRFGYTANSTEVDLRATFQEPVFEGCETSPECILRWMSYPQRAYLDSVTDLYNNTMTFDYTPQLNMAALYNPVVSPEPVDMKSFNIFARLKQVNYTGATRNISLEYAKARNDQPSADDILPGSTYRLYPQLMSAIAMSIKEDNFLRYEFDYDQVTFNSGTPWAKQVPVLKDITVKGKEDGNYQAFDAQTTFAYYSSWIDPRKGRLYQIDNGYGGVTTFNYTLSGKRVEEIKKEAPGAEPIIQTFRRSGIPGERHVWVWNGEQSSAETVTHYVYYTPFDSSWLAWLFNDDEATPADSTVFDTNLPPLVGQLKRVEVFDADQVRTYHGPAGYGAPLQATCYEYDLGAINTPPVGQNVFVAPQKVTTVYDGDCNSPDGIAVEYQYDNDYGNLETTIERGDPDDGQPASRSAHR
jgi:hypothetical protein